MPDGDDTAAGDGPATGGDAAVKEQVRQYWDDRAESFDDDPQHGIQSAEQRERWLSVLRDRAGDPPRRVLDVGCGTGFLALLLADLGHETVGVDVAPEMLERARTKARDGGRGADFSRADAERLPLANDAVDLVVARHLIWTLPAPATALAEWQRVLRPGGRILLVEGYWDFDEHPGEYGAVHEDLPLVDGRPPGELAGFLADNGLEDVEHEPLDDPVLWGREPHYDYYVMAGELPAR